MPVSVDESEAQDHEGEPVTASKSEVNVRANGDGAGRRPSLPGDSGSSRNHNRKKSARPRPKNLLRRFFGPRRNSSHRNWDSTGSRGSNISVLRPAPCTTPERDKAASVVSSPGGIKTETSTPPSSPESAIEASLQDTDKREESFSAATASLAPAQVDNENGSSSLTVEMNPALSPLEVLLGDPNWITNVDGNSCPPIRTERSADDPVVMEDVAPAEALDSNTAAVELAVIASSRADDATTPMVSPVETSSKDEKHIPNAVVNSLTPILTERSNDDPLVLTEAASAEAADFISAALKATSAAITTTTTTASSSFPKAKAEEERPWQDKGFDDSNSRKVTVKGNGSDDCHHDNTAAAEADSGDSESLIPDEQRDFPHESLDISTGNEEEDLDATQTKKADLPLQSEEKKDNTVSVPTAAPTVRNSEIFQKSLWVRRQKSYRSLDLGAIKSYSTKRRRNQNRQNQSSTTRDRNSSRSSSRSRSRRSVRSNTVGKSSASVDSGRSSLSCDSSSVTSVQSYLSLSGKVKSLLELAVEVVNLENLEEVASYYHKAIHAAGLEIMEINKHMTSLQGDDGPSIKSKEKTYHEDLRMIGIIIGMLRTKMAIVYTDAGDYKRALELCSGATQVHKHQPALRVVHQKFLQQQTGDQIARLMVVIIERLEKAQTCLEEHIELLKSIDLHSIHLDESLDDDDISILTSKEILYGMLAGKATDDGSITTYQGDDTLDLLSVHAVEQDKHDMAIHYLRDALQVHLVAMGTKRTRVSQSLVRVATMYRGGPVNNRKNEALVLRYFEQAASVLKQSHLGPHARGALLNDIAVIHLRRKDYDEAMKFLLDALRAYDEEELPSVGGGEKPRAPLATLYVWRNLGDCYVALKHFRSAEGAFLRALELQKESRKIQLAAEDLNLNIIGLDKSMLPLVNDANITDTICRVGKARAAQGGHKRALDSYQEALSVINRNAAIPKTDSMENELIVKSDQLSNVLYCIAESCRELADFEKAHRMYSLSLGLRTSGTAYRNDKRKSSRVHCLLCFVGIGKVYVKAKDFPNALKQYKEALSYAMGSGIKEDHPIVLSLNQHIKDVANSMKGEDSGSSPFSTLERKADNEIERGELDSATETLKELLVLRRAALQELKDNGQDTSDQVFAIACLLQTFGFVFAKNGDDENAERAFKDAARLFKKCGNQRVRV